MDPSHKLQHWTREAPFTSLKGSGEHDGLASKHSSLRASRCLSSVCPTASSLKNAYDDLLDKTHFLWDAGRLVTRLLPVACRIGLFKPRMLSSFGLMLCLNCRMRMLACFSFPILYLTLHPSCHASLLRRRHLPSFYIMQLLLCLDTCLIVVLSRSSSSLC